MSNPSILIVDDEPMILDILRLHFELEDFTVIDASSGNKAIEVLKQKKDEIGVIVSDVRMPDGNGIDLLDALRGDLKDSTPLIFVSGYAEITEDEAIEKGALALLPKPVDFDTLLDFVRKAME